MTIINYSQKSKMCSTSVVSNTFYNNYSVCINSTKISLFQNFHTTGHWVTRKHWPQWKHMIKEQLSTGNGRLAFSISLSHLFWISNQTLSQLLTWDQYLKSKVSVSDLVKCQGLVLSVYIILEEAVPTFRRLVTDVPRVFWVFLFFRRN